MDEGVPGGARQLRGAVVIAAAAFRALTVGSFDSLWSTFTRSHRSYWTDEWFRHRARTNPAADAADLRAAATEVLVRIRARSQLDRFPATQQMRDQFAEFVLDRLSDWPDWSQWAYRFAEGMITGITSAESVSPDFERIVFALNETGRLDQFVVGTLVEAVYVLVQPTPDGWRVARMFGTELLG